MISRDVTISNLVENGDRKVNAKSLLGVLSLGIAQGMTITLTANGTGEEEALKAMIELINSGFADI